MREAHVGELNWDPAVFGYTIGADGDDLTFDERDSAPFMPKCEVVDPSFDWGAPDARPRAMGPHDLLRNPRARLHEAASGRAGEACAAPSRASGTKEVIEYIKASA